MPKTPISTVEDLAAMTQGEFLTVGKRIDRLDGKVDAGFAALTDILGLMRADVHDIKITLGGLVRTVTALDESVRRLDKRVTRLEGKTGIAK